MSDPATPRAGRLQSWRLALVALGALVALDQVSKQIVVASVTPGEERNFFLGLDLVHVRNDGVAFGFLSDGSTLVVALTALSLAGLISYFAWRAETPWLWLPVGMILGGALGNLADRAREGAVIDFVDPIAWPAFNLADAAIVLGVFGLLYVAEGGRERPGPSPPR